MHGRRGRYGDPVPRHRRAASSRKASFYLPDRSDSVQYSNRQEESRGPEFYGHHEDSVEYQSRSTDMSEVYNRPTPATFTNQTTAALEASLMLLTKLASTYNTSPSFIPEKCIPHHDSCEPYQGTHDRLEERPIPKLMDLGDNSIRGESYRNFGERSDSVGGNFQSDYDYGRGFGLDSGASSNNGIRLSPARYSAQYEDKSGRHPDSMYGKRRGDDHWGGSRADVSGGSEHDMVFDSVKREADDRMRFDGGVHSSTNYRGMYGSDRGRYTNRLASHEQDARDVHRPHHKDLLPHELSSFDDNFNHESPHYSLTRPISYSDDVEPREHSSRVNYQASESSMSTPRLDSSSTNPVSLGRRRHHPSNRYKSDSDAYPPPKRKRSKRPHQHHDGHDHHRLSHSKSDGLKHKHGDRLPPPKQPVMDRLGSFLPQGCGQPLSEGGSTGQPNEVDITRRLGPVPANIVTRLGPFFPDLSDSSTLPDLREKLNEMKPISPHNTPKPLFPPLSDNPTFGDVFSTSDDHTFGDVRTFPTLGVVPTISPHGVPTPSSRDVPAFPPPDDVPTYPPPSDDISSGNEISIAESRISQYKKFTRARGSPSTLVQGSSVPTPPMMSHKNDSLGKFKSFSLKVGGTQPNPAASTPSHLSTKQSKERSRSSTSDHRRKKSTSSLVKSVKKVMELSNKPPPDLEIMPISKTSSTTTTSKIPTEPKLQLPLENEPDSSASPGVIPPPSVPGVIPPPSVPGAIAPPSDPRVTIIHDTPPSYPRAQQSVPRAIIHDTPPSDPRVTTIHDTPLSVPGAITQLSVPGVTIHDTPPSVPGVTTIHDTPPSVPGVTTIHDTPPSDASRILLPFSHLDSYESPVLGYSSIPMSSYPLPDRSQLPQTSSNNLRTRSESEDSDHGLVIDEDSCIIRNSPAPLEGGEVVESPACIVGESACEKVTIHSSELEATLVSQLLASNLLQRLYDSMRIIQFCLNGEGAGHLQLVPRIRTMFSSYSVSSATAKVELNDLYRMELSHLNKKCGDDVSKWQEKIRRFNLLASKLPKCKGDLESENKSGSVVATEPVTDVIVISDDEEGEGMNDEGDDSVFVKLEPIAIPPIALQELLMDNDKEDGELSDDYTPVLISACSEHDKNHSIDGLQPPAGTREADVREGPSSTSTDCQTETNTATDKDVSSRQATSHENNNLSDDRINSTIAESINTTKSPEKQSKGLMEVVPVLKELRKDSSTVRITRHSTSVGQSSVSMQESSVGEETVKKKNSSVEQGLSEEDELKVPSVMVDRSLDYGSSSGECNMSVCSTASDDEQIGNDRPTLAANSPICEKENDKDFSPQRRRSLSLSSGELTPTPPLSPNIKIQNEKKLAQPGVGIVATGGSHGSHSPPKQGPSGVGSTHLRKVSRHRTLTRKKRGVALSHSLNRSRSRNRSRSQSRNRYQSSFGVRSSRGRSHRGRYKRLKKSRSPISQRHQAKSPGNKSRGYGTSRKRSHSPQPTRGRTSMRVDEEDLELLQLKKEVILSIVQKPELETPSPLLNEDVSSDEDDITKDTKSNENAVQPQMVRQSSPVLTTPPISNLKCDHPLLAAKADSSHTNKLENIHDKVILKGLKMLPESVKSSHSSLSSSRPGSQPGSGPSSRPGSQPGSGSSSRPGSGANSPTNQSSPTRQESKKKGLGKSRSTLSVKQSVSIKVCPGNDKTWKIQPFHIRSSGIDSDSESGDVSEGGGSFSEISILLSEARKVATQASISHDKGPSTSSTESLDLPNPPSTLPLLQQKEYMLLQRKIALHEKKRLKDSLASSNANGPSLKSQPSSNDNDSPVGSNVSQPAGSDVSRPAGSDVSRPAGSDVSRPAGSDVSRPGSRPLNTEKKSRAVPKTSALPNMKEEEENKIKLVECQKKLTKYSKRMEDCKLKQEQEQQRITTLTNQLTSCVSEVEDYERIMETVQQQLASLYEQLQMAEKSLKSCEQNMINLQENVRSAQEKKTTFSLEVKDCEKMIAEQKKELELYESHYPASIIPVLEYESISDYEGSPCATKTPTTCQNSYDAVSDSESLSTCYLSLARSNIHIEPISDAEDVCVMKTMEVELVSDEEPESSKRKDEVDREVAMEDTSMNDPDLHTTLIPKEHDYFSSDGNIVKTPCTTLYRSQGIDDIQRSDEEITSEIICDFTEVSHDESTSVCRRTLPFVRLETSSSPGSKSRRKSCNPRRLKSNPGPSSMDMENILNVAMKSALSPTLSKFPSALSCSDEEYSRSCSIPVTCSSSASAFISSESNIPPLLNSVVSLLTQESITNITSAPDNKETGLRQNNIVIPDSSSEEEWYVNLHSRFHPCKDDLFTRTTKDPPQWIIPRHSHDFPLPVESVSVDVVALEAVRGSLSLALATEEPEDDYLDSDFNVVARTVEKDKLVDPFATSPENLLQLPSSDKCKTGITRLSDMQESYHIDTSCVRSSAAVETAKKKPLSSLEKAEKKVPKISADNVQSTSVEPSVKARLKQPLVQNLEDKCLPSTTDITKNHAKTAKKQPSTASLVKKQQLPPTPKHPKKQVLDTQRKNPSTPPETAKKISSGAPVKKPMKKVPPVSLETAKKQQAPEVPKKQSSLETAKKQQGPPPTEVLKKQSSLETAKKQQAPPPTEVLKKQSSLETAKKQQAPPPTEVLKKQSSLETAKKQQAPLRNKAKKQPLSLKQQTPTTVIVKIQHAPSPGIAKKQPADTAKKQQAPTPGIAKKQPADTAKKQQAPPPGIAKKQPADTAKKQQVPTPGIAIAKKQPADTAKKQQVPTPGIAIAKKQPADTAKKQQAPTEDKVKKQPSSSLDTSKTQTTVLPLENSKKLSSMSTSLVATKKQLSSSKETETCARTQGLRKSITVQTSLAEGFNPELSGTVLDLINKIILAKNGSELINKLCFMDAVGPETTLDFTTLSFLSSNCVIKNKTFLSAPLKLPNSFIAEMENTPATTLKSTISNTYQPPSSSLLKFRSYRLNPAFRANDKIPLSSMSYSNKIDPNKVMCRFEVTGVCIDPKCTAQHVRDIAMTKEELVQDLISYTPTVAGCTPQELALAEGSDQNKTAEVISGKIASYSSKLLERYGDRVSDEELYRLVVHEVNTERLKNNPKKSFISFEDHQPRNRARSETQPKESSERSLDYSAVIDTDPEAWISPLYMSPKVEERRRYFHEDDNSTRRSSDDDTSSPASILTSAQNLIKEQKLNEAVLVLEGGLEQDTTSEEVWTCYLQLKSQMATPSQLQTLYQLFSKAVSSSKSYEIVLETIRLARCYYSKFRAISDGLAWIRINSSNMELELASHLSLELLLNAVLLALQIGRPSIALKCFDEARLPSEEGKNFTGLLATLQKPQSLLLSLCHLCVLYAGQLPNILFGADSHHVLPVHLSNCRSFAIPFDRSINLPEQEYKKILRLFKVYFGLLQDDTVTNSISVELNLPLYKNLLLFEATHGNDQKTINMLNKLTGHSPHLSDLWLTLARIMEVSNMDSIAVLKRATKTCVRKPELHYLAARLELSRNKDTPANSDLGKCDSTPSHEQHVQRAVNWLISCVKKFYVEQPEKLCTAQVLTLYRKLLTQMIGYNQVVPSFAEDVNPKSLGDELTPLWMCYCLLVELTVPPSLTSSGSELFHQTTEEAYESAVHMVHSCDGHRAVWREYILYMRSKALSTSQGFKHLLDCVHRCVMDVEWTYTIPGSSNLNEDYSFHNEMISIVGDCLPNSSFKLSLLKKFSTIMPKNTILLTRVVVCALQQKPVCLDIAQTTLAEYLAHHPHSPALWKLAIDIELQLHHSKEVRWMFNQALHSLPLHARLWRDFFLFELKEAVSSSSVVSDSSATSWRLLGLVKRAHLVGVNLLKDVHV